MKYSSRKGIDASRIESLRKVTVSQQSKVIRASLRGSNICYSEGNLVTDNIVTNQIFKRHSRAINRSNSDTCASLLPRQQTGSNRHIYTCYR